MFREDLRKVKKASSRMKIRMNQKEGVKTKKRLIGQMIMSPNMKKVRKV